MTNNAHSLPFSPLELDAAAEVERIAEKIRQSLRFNLRKRGLVLGISGGIDSSVCAALAVHALGAANVIGLFMPENDSDPDSLRLGQALATKLGMDCVLEDIGPSLAAMGCYERRDGFIREVVPEYGPGWASKIVFDNAMSTGAYNISSLVVRSPSGETRKVRLSAKAYLGIVAATNMKQRTRKQFEYYHADRLNFAVLGTPNRLEYDQGFFVKNGDGAADIKPIAHLYKSQVYQLAAHLGVPQEIRARPPTTDTYSMPQTQEEFYFALPYDKMDICLYGLEHDLPATEIATATGLTEENVRFVWTDIAAKRKVAHYLHHAPIHLHEGIQAKS
ncbi:MAG: NAD(+) synthase [Agrobacterium sp.]|nr:NAD(+) synthase [Agrobacterium sp.]